ncbi:hypothetical protein PHYPO_G00198690 [Pangasianodon hypophthalmus]|uniref:SEA domain-containing protein n=1 Tax=Pangasianodon hypophthalmus TaxID=310915 RepID=A0A5N5PJC3_PANHP|nr:uncharacterized protein si:ch73-344o19.1 isoform X2 [Pangasianodon hypophthalmus]KAB5579759.1 hypothetical protein PHYPO_G00198690 [Pangasianodon hypophthalmus]
MDALVCVVWSVALLTHTPSLKAESSASVPASTTVSLNEAIDLFVTSKITDPKEPIRTDISRPPPPPQHISSTSTERDRAQGASTASLLTLTSILTTNHANTKITDTEEPNTETTIGTGIIQPAESIMSTNATEGSLDITPSLILLRSTTITPGSSIPSSTNLSEEQNSSQSTTSETIPTVSLIPPSIPASTLKDLITGSASLGKENQDWPSELDVGDEDSDKLPSPSPLDPLLAGLISIFIISTALLSIILFLKFCQQSGHPEFHRLQDLPMDDLLEDTPLSRYSY